MAVSLYHFPSVECHLRTPIVGTDGTVVAGFAASYYVVADSDEAAVNVVRADCSANEADLAGFEPPKMMGRFAAPWHALPRAFWTAGPKVAWRSGRAFFPLEDGEH
jgi:hypothetical protein